MLESDGLLFELSFNAVGSLSWLSFSTSSLSSAFEDYFNGSFIADIKPYARHLFLQEENSIQICLVNGIHLNAFDTLNFHPVVPKEAITGFDTFK